MLFPAEKPPYEFERFSLRTEFSLCGTLEAQGFRQAWETKDFSKKFNVNGMNGLSILHIAIICVGHLEQIEELLRAGANPNQLTDEGKSPLILVAETTLWVQDELTGDELFGDTNIWSLSMDDIHPCKIISALLKYGADPDYVTPEKKTVMHSMMISPEKTTERYHRPFQIGHPAPIEMLIHTSICDHVDLRAGQAYETIFMAEKYTPVGAPESEHDVEYNNRKRIDAIKNGRFDIEYKHRVSIETSKIKQEIKAGKALPAALERYHAIGNAYVYIALFEEAIQHCERRIDDDYETRRTGRHALQLYAEGLQHEDIEAGIELIGRTPYADVLKTQLCPPLYIALGHRNAWQIVNALLMKAKEAGDLLRLVNTPAYNGLTPVRIAMQSSNELALKLLVEAGADLTHETLVENRPFMNQCLAAYQRKAGLESSTSVSAGAGSSAGAGAGAAEYRTASMAMGTTPLAAAETSPSGPA